MADTNVNIKLNLQGKEAVNTAFKNLNKTLGTVQKSASNTRTGFIDIARILGTGGVLFTAFTALKSGITAAVGEFVEFEKRIKEINTILPNNARVTEDMVDALKDLSDQFATTTTEQARALYQVISAGTTEAAAAVDLLDSANKLALGGLGQLNSSIDLLTDIINVYGKTNITAADAADTLFTAVRLGKTTISQLSTSLGSVIPVGASLGITFEEIAGTLATLTTKGQSTAERVTQLNAIFTAVLKKGSEAGKFGKEVGDAFNITALRTKGLSKFLQDLTVATGGSEEILTKLFGRVEGSKAVLALASDNFKKLNDTLVQFKSKAGAADKAVNEIKTSISFNFDQAIRGIKNIGLGLVESASPIINKSLKLTNKLFKNLGVLSGTTQENLEFQKKEVIRLTEAYNRLSFNARQGVFGEPFLEDIEKAKEKIKELKEALKGTPIQEQEKNVLKLRKAFDKLSEVDKTGFFGRGIINNIKETEKEIARLRGTLGAPINLKGVQETRNKLKQQFNEIAKDLKDAGKTQIQILQESFDARGKILSEAFKKGATTRKEFEEVSTKLQQEFQEKRKKLLEKEKKEREKANREESRRLKELSKLRLELLDVGKNAATNPFEALNKGLDEFLSKLTKEQKIKLKPEIEQAELTQTLGIGLGFAKTITEGAKGAQKLLVQGASAAIDTIVPGLGAAAGPLLDAFAQGPEETKKMVQEFARALPDLIENIIDSIPVFIETLIDEAPRLIDSLVQKAPAIIRSLVSKIPSIITAFVDAMPQVAISLAAQAPMIASEMALALVAEAPSIALAIIKGLIPGMSGITGGLKKAGQGLVNAGKKVFEKLTEVGNKIFELWKKIPALMLKAFTGIASILGKALGSIGTLIVKSVGDAGKKFVTSILGGAESFIKKIIELIPGGKLLTGGGGGGGGGIIPGVNIIPDSVPIIGGLFAKGGMVPEGFPGDTFPARLSSGEFVIDRSLTSRLERALDNGSVGGGNNQVSDALLIKVVDLLSNPIQTSATIELNDRTFADILLTLNRTNARVTA